MMPANPAPSRCESSAAISADRSIFWLMSLAALVFTALHKIAIPSPILAGDEYAYLAAVLDAIDKGKRIDLDPMLQNVYLPMFTWFGVVTAQLTTALVPIYKALNFIFFVTATLLFIAIARALAPARNVPLLALALCISPFSAYVAYMMPESLYYFLYAAIAASLILITPRRPRSGLLLAGIATAALVLTKPHAIAIIAATLATLMSHCLFYEKTWRAGLMRGAWSCAAYIAVTLIAMICLNRITTGALVLNPYHLIGDFYRPFLQGAVDSAGLSTRLGIMLRNGIGHALVVAALAFLPLYCVLASWISNANCRTRDILRERSRWLPSNAEFLLVAFAVFSLATMVLMTVNFTAQVTKTEGGAALRLYGRYYSFAIPLFLIMIALINNGASHLLSRIRRGIYLAIVIGFGLLVRNKFTVFPWDFPEIVILTQVAGVLGGLPPKLFFIAVIAVLLMPARMTLQRFFLASWIAVFFASLIFMSIWQKTQTSAFIGEINAGKAAHTLLNLNPSAQSIAVVGSERYGRMAYFLFNLAANPRVIVAPQPADNLDVALGQAGWVFSLYKQELNLEAATATGTIGPIRFFRRDRAAPYTLEKVAMWDSRALLLNFGAGRDDGMLTGGNSAEPWGTWTAAETALIHLPAMVSGSLRVTLDGWVAAENAGKPVKITLGDASARVALLDRREAFSVELNVNAPSRELVISGIKPLQPNPWDRPLAVALASLRIERTTP